MNQARSGGFLYEVPPYAPKRVRLWIIVPTIIGALLVSHLLAVGYGLHDGFQRGRAHEKQIAENTPKPAATNCKEWLRQCSAEAIDRWKRK